MGAGRSLGGSGHDAGGGRAAWMSSQGPRHRLCLAAAHAGRLRRQRASVRDRGRVYAWHCSATVLRHCLPRLARYKMY
eukprot:scaffold14258_cov73-Phaeocystis_antarctica.AAC.1